MKQIIAIVAMCEKTRTIAINNRIPWWIEEDMLHFHKSTYGHHVVMGRNTFNSLPVNARPLAGRTNIVITSAENKLKKPKEGIIIKDSIEATLNWYENDNSNNVLWICGGEGIYKGFLNYCDEIHVSKIKGIHPGDKFMPEFESNFSVYREDEREQFKIEYYKRK